MSEHSRPRLLVLIVAYHAEATIRPTLERIPASLLDTCDVEVLVIDDSSADGTFEQSDAVRRAETLPFPLTVLSNPANQGYGGNQKIGLHFAIQQQFDFVVLLHGDGQYAPECLPDLVAPLARGEADAVLGSRMLRKRDALRGGMPLYKFLGNIVLTSLQNRLLRSSLSEFHSGYRAYTTNALRRIPFHLNTNAFHFDTEIIIQLLAAGLRIREVPIPTYYGREISRVNGIKYGKDVLMASVRALAQELSLFYDRKFDPVPSTASNVHYKPRLGFESAHTMALARIPDGSRVVDIGCAGGYLGQMLRQRGCHVTGTDVFPLAEGCTLDDFRLGDLNQSPFPVDLEHVDYAVMLDVIEHLASPERFVDDFIAAAAREPEDQAGRQHGERGVHRREADAARRPVQLREARHPGPHAHAAVHVRHLQAPVRAVRPRRPRAPRRAGAVSARAGERGDRTTAARNEQGASPRQPPPLRLPDFRRGPAQTGAGVPAGPCPAGVRAAVGVFCGNEAGTGWVTLRARRRRWGSGDGRQMWRFIQKSVG